MKKQEWTEGLDRVDIEIVEIYVEQKNKFQALQSQREKRFRRGFFAACLALLLVSVIVIRLASIPVWHNARYSAKEIAALFGNHDNYLGAGTSAYQEVCVPDEKYLNIEELSDEKYIPIYKYNVMGKYPYEEEFKEFIDGILPKYAESICVEIPQYEIEDSLFSNDKHAKFDSEDMKNMGGQLFVNQDRIYSRFAIQRDPITDILLRGEYIQTDTRLSDEEILSSLESIKSKLFYIFGVSFPDVEIVRTFDDYRPSGTSKIVVYFYDKEASVFSSVLGIAPEEFISIEFYNFEYSIYGTDEDYLLKATNIIYRKCRVDSSKMYTHFADAERISLEDAEALLYKGYVFGGHSCSACMQAQEKVDFEGYDFVKLKYVSGRSNGHPTVQIPFYAFYKKIGIATNGNIIYARTYVPAIKVKGYEKYFKNQEKEHN